MKHTTFFHARLLLMALALLTALTGAHAQQRGRNYKFILRIEDPGFYRTDEARRIGDQLLLYQRNTGGWPKNIDMVRALDESEKHQVLEQKKLRYDSTTDNDATTIQMVFLARLYEQTHEKKYSDAFRKGVEYLLSGQYKNGGWPQFWPEMRDYQIHITYNDDAMVNTMCLLRDIAAQKAPYGGDLTTEKQRQRMTKAFDKGVECILNTQIKDREGRLTVWCQQHDRKTLLPAKARAYELPSYCSMESASIVKLLMELPNPDERVFKAVDAAMVWLDAHKLMGYRVERRGYAGGPQGDTELVADPSAGPLWARYYDLENEEPFVCDRDGIPRHSITELSSERRNGYAWYSDRPGDLYSKYKKWVKKHPHAGAVTLEK